MAKKNYIIGKAHNLTETVPPPPMNPNREPLYTLEESLSRVIPQLERVTNSLNALNENVCPRDYAVTQVTLHPSFLAKSFFPARLLREMGVRSIGSKSSSIKPDRWTRKGPAQKSPTTCLFVAGQRRNLIDFKEELSFIQEKNASSIVDSTDYSISSGDLEAFWSIETVSPDCKIKESEPAFDGYFEIGLHLIPNVSSSFIKDAFFDYAESLGFSAERELALEVSNLWFVPVNGDPTHLKELAKFSFVRVVRPLPAMRTFRPLVRSHSPVTAALLPNTPSIAEDFTVAILDGGLPTEHALEPWIRHYRRSDIHAADIEGGPEHGLAVTSSFLFGPLTPNVTAPRPFCRVDHHRVLDQKASHEDPLELYRTLNHIEDILISRQYEFINLSLGPDLPIDDDEIHPWTSLLDEYLADGDTFLTVAAGNNGDRDAQTGLNRIQVPSDSVNSVAVGASDSLSETEWQRANYSAVGPGRSPGRIKPDLLAFGGSFNQYFHVLGGEQGKDIVPQCGTSFAAPYLLRNAAAIRALFGPEISTIAIKALLVNTASQNGHDKNSVGWGCVSGNIDKIIESPDGTARILYQGELYPGKYLRVPLPLPSEGIKGNVSISATCCFTSTVDPQDTGMYTKSGLDISWSPNIDKTNENGRVKTEPFFKQNTFATEAELRSDAGKWETVLHSKKNKRGSSMKSPYFTIHYGARDSGASATSNKSKKIKYAFVVTLECKNHKEIFTDIIAAYPAVLAAIEPRITTEIQVST